MKRIFRFLYRNKKINYAFVRKHYSGNGLEGMSKEEIREYYYALGRADTCSEVLYMLNSQHRSH
ncbi:MAG: hypothetical protein E7678_06950 [Ruminococcaceae bacterium]|nr:hypothetical protein [Oscillospiraceae bacterium]